MNNFFELFDSIKQSKVEINGKEYNLEYKLKFDNHWTIEMYSLDVEVSIKQLNNKNISIVRVSHQDLNYVINKSYSQLFEFLNFNIRILIEREEKWKKENENE